MAKRLAQRIGRRKRSHQVGEAEKIIPINHETAEIIAQQKKLFREQFGREPGPGDPLFFDPGVAAPQFLSEQRAVFLSFSCTEVVLKKKMLGLFDKPSRISRC